MKFSLLASTLALLTGLAAAVPAEITERAELEARAAAHTFTLINKCSYAVTPRVADTRCGYSPRTPHDNFTATVKWTNEFWQDARMRRRSLRLSLRLLRRADARRFPSLAACATFLI